MRTTVLAPWLGALAVALAGCGGSERAVVAHRASSATPRAVDPPEPQDGQAAMLRIARTAYGSALIDRRGFALYLFTHDRSASSTCYGACAAAWPPYLIAKRPSGAARGAHRRLVGAVRRRDGRLQLTYAGHPLYYYVGDRRPGEVLCQAVPAFGGTWYVVAPSGDAIH